MQQKSIYSNGRCKRRIIAWVHTNSLTARVASVTGNLYMQPKSGWIEHYIKNSKARPKVIFRILLATTVLRSRSHDYDYTSQWNEVNDKTCLTAITDTHARTHTTNKVQSRYTQGCRRRERNYNCRCAPAKKKYSFPYQISRPVQKDNNQSRTVD